MNDVAKGPGRQDWSERVRKRALELWHEEGAPEGQFEQYRQKAEELLAIESNQEATLKPNPMHSPEQPGEAEPVEPAEALENQGELPGLADQGEESPAPPSRENEKK